MISTIVENKWIVSLRNDKSSKLRLFCFPYAGGNSFIFRTWTKSLPSDVELFPIELPGHGSRLHEDLYTSISGIVPEIGNAIVSYLDRPFAFFGHSMGALLSFELTRLLRKHHMPRPHHLFISGHCAPQIPRTRPPTYSLPEKEFIKELHNLQGTPEEVINNNELMEILLPVLRADFKMSETYSYKPEIPLKVPITVFGGNDDKNVSKDNLRAWKEQTRSSFKLHLIPGNHFFLNTNQAIFFQTFSNDLRKLISVQ